MKGEPHALVTLILLSNTQRRTLLEIWAYCEKLLCIEEYCKYERSLEYLNSQDSENDSG